MTYRRPHLNEYRPGDQVVLSHPHYPGRRGMVRWMTDSAMGPLVNVWVYACNQTVAVAPRYVARYTGRRNPWDGNISVTGVGL